MSTQATPCTIDINDGKLQLTGKAGTTLFAAFRMNKILLPTGCGARGVCGQCKVRVTGGEAGLMTDAEAKLITEAERAQGCRLACQVRLTGDLKVTIPDYVFAARDHAATLTAITPLTHDIKRFSFALAEGDGIPHRAGQFMTLAAKIPEQQGLTMRCFSFATPSGVTDSVDIIARRTPHGVMTPFLFDKAAPGDAFTITAPYGDFYLRDGSSPCVWIAGGSGLSPFLGMIRDMVDSGRSRPVHLFFGAVLPQDLYYVELLREIAATHKWFRFTPALSGPEHCEFCRDYGLNTEVVSKHVGDASTSEGYLCGSPGMIAACLKVLGEKGIRRDRVYYDRF
jgi:Na+-transporting NADH:ubiquinone oxidoreductase subunit F